MIAATRRWLRRNRNNIFIGAGVLGAGYLAGQYVLGKIQEARQRMSEEKIAKENLRRRFEQNQEDCTYTVLALLPTVRDEIIGSLPVEQITEQLQQERQERLKRLGASEAASSEFPSAPPSAVDDDSRSLASSSYVHASQVAHSSLNFGEPQAPRPKRSKAQLWQDMKINSIARALTLIYTLCLLTILTRIQLNLLGRRTYLSSVVAMATPPAATQSTISLENRDDDNYDNVYGNDFETNRKYLTFSWWLLHRGSKRIMERVMVAVKEVFGGVNIREDISFERLADLLMQVRRRVEGETEEERRSMKWLEYLLPPKSEETFVIRQSGMSESDESPSPEAQNPNPMESAMEEDEEQINASLRRLLDETADLVDSPTFSYVLTRLLDAGFSHLVDYRIATEAYKTTGPPAPGTEAPRIVEISDTKCKLAHVLPVFCKQAHIISAGSGELDTLDGVAAQEALGNEYLTAIDQTSDLGAFAAVIYSSNFEYEVPDFVGAAAAPKAPREDSSSLNSPELIAHGEVPTAVLPINGQNTLEQSEVLVLSGGPEERNEPAPAPAPATDSGAGRFEAAWQKATSATGEEEAVSSTEQQNVLPLTETPESEQPRVAPPVVAEPDQQQKPKDEEVIKLA